MQLYHAIRTSFQQLTEVLDQLSAEQYKTPSTNLSGSSVGQHTRHIIELFQCLLKGYASGRICYDDRKRDVAIESDPALARQLLQDISSSIEQTNIELELTGVYDDTATEPLLITTNYHRELLYNLEHSIHHMALIRVGLKELKTELAGEHFGIASSTIRHREQCAQ